MSPQESKKQAEGGTTGTETDGHRERKYGARSILRGKIT